MANGYAFEFNGKGYWFLAPGDDWEIVCFAPTGREKRVGVIEIGRCRYPAFKCADGKVRAQI